jgi:RNA polymerase sigma-70 factor (ECF subfamily)
VSDHETTRLLQGCLDRLRAGDVTARRELIEFACARLRRLASLMLGDFRRLRRWEDSDDVLQEGLLRLCRALEDVTPASVREFFQLATLQLRRVLLDLSRHHFGPRGGGTHHQTPVEVETPEGAGREQLEQADDTLNPEQLARWAEFHRQAEALEVEERETFDLLWYQELTQTEAAAVLGVSVKTVKRRWQAACLKMHEALGGDLPVP